MTDAPDRILINRLRDEAFNPRNNLAAQVEFIRAAEALSGLQAESQRLRETLEAARFCLDFMAAGDDEAAGMAKLAISAMDRAALRSTREGG